MTVRLSDKFIDFIDAIMVLLAILFGKLVITDLIELDGDQVLKVFEDKNFFILFQDQLSAIRLEDLNHARLWLPNENVRLLDKDL